VQVATSVGGYGPGSVLESMLAIALTLRGARVHTLLCDQILPGCLRAEHTDVPDPTVLAEYRLPQTICGGCVHSGQYNFAPLELNAHTFGGLVGPNSARDARQLASNIPLADIRAFRQGRLSLGEHAYAGTLRYFAKGNLDGEPHGEPVLRRYLEASLLAASAVERLVREQGIERACFNHGLYVPQGVVGEVCRDLDVPVVNWNPAYRTSCFIFSHGD
jgi:hypothetical protein